MKNNRKIVKLISAAAAGASLMLFAGCSVDASGSLTSLTKPYAGVYECRTLRIGDTDYADRVEDFTIELAYDGTYTLSYIGENGAEGEAAGKYNYNEETGKLTLYTSVRRRTRAYEFDMKEGTISLTYNLGGKLLYCEFVPQGSSSSD